MSVLSVLFRPALPILLFLSVFGLLTLTAGAQFDPFENPCDSAPNSPTCQQVAEQQAAGTDPIAGPNGIIQKAANLIAVVGGIIAVIIIIVSGIMFITAGGAVGGQRAGDNPNRARQARGALIGAVIGLIVMVMAWTIVSFFNNWVIGP